MQQNYNPYIQHDQQQTSRAPYANAAYLLGMGPMPPPRPQDIAVARLNAAMDSGAFENAGPVHNAAGALLPASEYIVITKGVIRTTHGQCLSTYIKVLLVVSRFECLRRGRMEGPIQLSP